MFREEEFATLADWFEGPLGVHVLTAELEFLDARLPQLYGFHLMQLSVCKGLRLANSSMIRHRFVLARSTTTPGVSACAYPEQLPIDGDCIDVALLHHVLEYSHQPHQLLREAARVVVPHGHLFVLGFNPWSLFGARAALSRHFTVHPVWQGAALAARRVRDWLELLDFAVEDIQYRVHLPPIAHAATLTRLAAIDRAAARWELPTGAIYMIHARKQLGMLTPVRNARRAMRPRLATLPLASPSTCNTSRHRVHTR